MSSDDFPTKPEGINISKAKVDADNIAGGHIFNVEGDLNTYAREITELRHGPFADAVKVAVDGFLHHIRLISKHAPDASEVGSDMTISQEEDRSAAYYDRNKFSNKRMTLRFDPLTMYLNIEPAADHFGKKRPWRRNDSSIDEYFTYRDTLLLSKPEALGNFGGGYGPMVLGWFAAGIGVALAPVTLGATAVVGVAAAGAAGASYVGVKKMREIKNEARRENAAKIQAFCDRGVEQIVSSRQSIVDTILFLSEPLSGSRSNL